MQEMTYLKHIFGALDVLFHAGPDDSQGVGRFLIHVIPPSNRAALYLSAAGKSRQGWVRGWQYL